MLAEFTFKTVPLAEIVKIGIVDETAPYRPVVLIVDDETIIADTRAAIFSSWGYTAMIAYSAEDALEIASVVPPELLVSDVMLAAMNGVDLAIAIQEMVRDCKVILFSGLPYSAEMVATARCAGHDFTLLDKPLHPAQILAELKRLKLGPPGTPGNQALNRIEM
jgi:DNA-binding NtrC family response regulator